MWNIPWCYRAKANGYLQVRMCNIAFPSPHIISTDSSKCHFVTCKIFPLSCATYSFTLSYLLSMPLAMTSSGYRCPPNCKAPGPATLSDTTEVICADAHAILSPSNACPAFDMPLNSPSKCSAFFRTARSRFLISASNCSALLRFACLLSFTT